MLDNPSCRGLLKLWDPQKKNRQVINTELGG